jgi:hypothetical protein
LTIHFRDNSIFQGVNTVLQKLPMSALGHFVADFAELLNYVVLLQAAVEVCASEQQIPEGCIVYLGLRNEELAGLYASAIGEVVVWPSFATASRDRARVASEYAVGDGGILFEIELVPGNIAAEIGGFADRAGVSEVLIAAESAFRIDSVEEAEEETLVVVHMAYVGTWSDGNIERNIRPLLVPA